MTHTNTYLSSEGIFRFNEVTSTNDMARKLWRDGMAKNGDCILANYQSAGRGQMGNNWQSDPNKNLLATILYEPLKLDAEKQIFMNMSVALALLRLIQSEGISNVSIKWPNDIMIGTEKTAGILIENTLQQQSIKLSLIGVGINLNQRIFSHGNATSLVLQDGLERDVEHHLHALRQLLAQEFELLENRMFQVIRQRFNKHMFRQGQRAYFIENDITFQAMILGADDLGRLELEQDGRIRRFHNKQIQWII